MQAEFVREETVVLRVAKRDTMGRTKELADQMSKNDPRPQRIGERDSQIAAVIEENLVQYPKCFYKVSLNSKGVPNGDDWPNCPLPSDLAADLGFDDCGFVNRGKRREDGGYVDVKFPYKTMLVGIRYDGVPLDGMTHEERNATVRVDIEKSRAQEVALRAKGWVDSISKLKFPETANLVLIHKLLGWPEPDEVELPTNGNGLAVSAPQNQSQSEMTVSAESNEPKESKRGGSRPGAGRKPGRNGLSQVSAALLDTPQNQTESNTINASGAR